ncbi:hypothetical protein BU23DRAFT_313566 [Bimuria novae-zelandiae CBS 107.79]|uniref:DUF6594 domain-containing protein n=1 Tax=Bimuria novae-zelandiae CBS 107.79 TaxID=1447943 RepID=A0A6A5V0A1_9PLEO|nr:hypothetical protein BU23DRAFT_313566 [Bimuria novae-zelandiae CBS 107.79]
MDCHEQASIMENGEAGMDAARASATPCEKSPSTLSPSITTSTKNLLPKKPGSVNYHWVSKARTKLGTMWSRSRTQTSQKQSTARTSIVRKITSCPRGYPSLATFLDSDECFMVYRRFGFLQSRLLLDKQDELRELERKLDRLDTIEAGKDVRWPMTRDVPSVISKPRKQLLQLIEEKYCSYANLLDAAQKMVAMHRPSQGDYTSVQNFMDNRKPLIQPEGNWVDHEEDLVTLRAGREHAWLDSGIEKMLKWFHCDLLERVFGDERSRAKSSDLEVYYSRPKISRLANTIITMMILILLIVPIYTMYHLIKDIQTDRAYALCMGILVVATLAFSAVLSLFTKAKRHEILAAAAAYCAVLVVFFGNVGTKSQTTGI